MVIPYEEFDPQMLLIQIIIQLVSIIFMVVISFMTWRKYIQRKSIEIKLVAIFMTAFWIGLSVGTFPMILCLYAPNWAIIFGIPVGNNLYLWWTNFSYILLSLGTIAVFKFIQKIFKKPSNFDFWLFVVATILFNVWSIYHGIFVYTPGTASLTLPMSGVYLLLNFWVWIMLFRYALYDSRRLDRSIFQNGLKIVAISGFFMILSYVAYILNVFIKGIGIISWGFNIITMVLLYIGYLLPGWYRRFLIKRGYPDA